MGRISGLAEVVLLVQDLDKSLAFYRDLLGMTGDLARWLSGRVFTSR